MVLNSTGISIPAQDLLFVLMKMSGLCDKSLVVGIILDLYEDWNFNSGNYLFTTDTK